MQQFVDGLAYIVDMGRLSKESRALVFRDLRVNFLVRSFPAHEKNGDMSGGLVAPEGFEKMRANHSRHLIIQHDDFRMELTGFFHPTHGFIGRADFVAGGFKGLRNDPHEVDVVIDNENFCH